MRRHFRESDEVELSRYRDSWAVQTAAVRSKDQKRRLAVQADPEEVELPENGAFLVVFG